MFLLSVSIFGLFLSLKIKSNVFINTIASTCLGVYLLHDGVLSSYILKDLLKANVHLSGRFPLLYIVLSTFIIFSIGVIIDLIRQFVEKRTIEKYVDNLLKLD
jgi:surface polysaccharide O-acyltransferase-like enzyme